MTCPALFNLWELREARDPHSGGAKPRKQQSYAATEKKINRCFYLIFYQKNLENSALTRRACCAPAVCAGDISLGTASQAGSEDKSTLQGQPAQIRCKIASNNPFFHGQGHFLWQKDLNVAPVSDMH